VIMFDSGHVRTAGYALLWGAGRSGGRAGRVISSLRVEVGELRIEVAALRRQIGRDSPNSYRLDVRARRSGDAGAGHPGRFVEQDLDDLHRRLRLNAVAHLELTHAFAQQLAARGRGGIVLVSALGASAGIPNMAHEAGSKAYVDALGTALHHELAGAGVKVLVMRPGNVDTAAPNRSANQTITRAPLVLGGDGTVTVGVVAGVAGVRSSVVLREAAHHGRTYELTGPASSTPRRRAADLAAALGRTQHRRLPLRSAPGREPRTGGGGPARCDASQLAPSRTSCSRRAKASGWPG